MTFHLWETENTLQTIVFSKKSEFYHSGKEPECFYNYIYS